MDVPSNCGSYMVQFEDDEDEHGSNPIRPLSPAFVVASYRAASSGAGKKH